MENKMKILIVMAVALFAVAAVVVAVVEIFSYDYTIFIEKEYTGEEKFDSLSQYQKQKFLEQNTVYLCIYERSCYQKVKVSRVEETLLVFEAKTRNIPKGQWHGHIECEGEYFGDYYKMSAPVSDKDGCS